MKCGPSDSDEYARAEREAIQAVEREEEAQRAAQAPEAQAEPPPAVAVEPTPPRPTGGKVKQGSLF